ncbi:MAG: KH domain-containing protein [Alphaproteobacteria bacterium]|nr:KH domain-containing protein [Alphaproteobacteria bacterium]
MLKDSEVEKTLLTYVKNICTGIIPEDSFKVEITEVDGNLQTIIFVKEEFVGRILGAKGRTVQALRTCLHAYAGAQGLRVNLSVEVSP